jgi:hypothetical protein
VAISVSTAAARAGEELTVSVSIANNPGFATLPLRISFPNELTLVRYDVPVSLRDGFTGPVGTTQGQRIPGGISSHVYMNWARSTNYTGDGTLLSLTFAINSNAAPGNYEINVAFRDIHGYCNPMDYLARVLGIALNGGYAQVVARFLGDVCGNGEIDMFDVTLIARHLAGHPNLHLLPGVTDFDISYGKVTPGSVVRGNVRLIDATMIARYLAGHPGIVLGEYPTV